MAYPVIIRRFMDSQSYLVLDENPRELLRHPGFQEEYSIRPWLGPTDPEEARESWSEMLGEDIDFYVIVDEDNWEYSHERSQWDHCLK
jgi:hypothetical protein